MDKTTNDIRLIVDDREHTIYNELVKRYPNELWYNKQRLKYGDFAIISSCECLLAIIERKTIADYGASIRDGRHKNKDKIIELRAKSQCDVYYVIEGDFYNTPDSNTANGIPMSTIRSSVYNLVVRDSIIPLIVDNHQKSISNLRGLIKSYQKHHKCKINKNKDILDNEIPINTAANIPINTAAIIPINTAINIPINTVAAVVTNDTNDQLTKGGIETSTIEIDVTTAVDIEEIERVSADDVKLKKADYQTLLNELPVNTIRANMLTTIPYITTRILTKLESYSIRELCIDHVLDGQPILTPKMNARFHITDTTLFERMLLCIPNMAKNTANKIANKITIADLADVKKIENIGNQTVNIIKRIIEFKPSN